MEIRIPKDDWREGEGSLRFAPSSLSLTLDADEVLSGSFLILNGSGLPTEGYVLCHEERMEGMTTFFSGSAENISFRFDGRGMEPGEVREGSFLILSNMGEYELSFTVSIAVPRLLSQSGELETLADYVRLARTSWEEAVRLFYEPAFVRLLHGGDAKYLDLYRGLSLYPGNKHNVEEFLVASNQKQAVEYQLSESQLVMYVPEDEGEKLCETLVITRNGWGQTQLLIELEGAFLSVERHVLRDEDFLGNHCSLQIYLSPEGLHGGNNYGRIRLRHAGGVLEAGVSALRRPALQKTAASRRRERGKLTVEIISLYQSYRMKKINLSLWRQRSGEVLERYKRLDDRSALPRLYQAHLLITQERYDEAGNILTRLRLSPEKNGPELYCYALYLTSLYKRDEASHREALARTEQMHRMLPESWQISWLLLYLSPTLGRSAVQRWSFLEEQFRHGQTSPVMYLEALHLAELSPTLLKKLDTYELQLLHYGARNAILSPDLVGHVVYLTEREKYYRKNLCDILMTCYHNHADNELLSAICTLLIKGNMSGAACFAWYRLAVEKQLRVTKLYEYFMMSLDPDDDIEIPRTVLMYFAYQSNLDAPKMAVLYAYLERHREELPDLYAAYRGQLERFVIQQLYKGNMDRHLAFLYQSLLEQGFMTGDNCEAMEPLLFLKQLDCDRQIRRVAVRHSRLAEETVYPVVNGRVNVTIYDSGAQIYLEDANHNRYTDRKRYKLTNLMLPAAGIRQMADVVRPAKGYALYLCADTTGGIVAVSGDNAPFFRYLTRMEGLDAEYASRVRMALLEYYDRTEWIGWEQMDSLDEPSRLLKELKSTQIRSGDYAMAVAYLVRYGYYEKAYEWMAGRSPEQVDAAVLLRLVSRLRERTAHTGEDRLTALAYSAYARGKYDAPLLEILANHYEGRIETLAGILQAATGYCQDTYYLTERLMVQILFTGSDAAGRPGLLEGYVRGGGRGELEAAYLHRACGQYLMQTDRGETASGAPGESVELSPCFLQNIGMMARRGEPLSDMCALAYLYYYAAHREERNPQVDEVVRLLGSQLQMKGILLPVFREYADILEASESLKDQAVVVYRGSRRKPVELHYRLTDGSRTLEEGTLRMRHVYAGIYTASFVLFVGELLEYTVCEVDGDGHSLDEGMLRMEGQEDEQGRYVRLNSILKAWLAGDSAEAQEQLEQYRRSEWIVEGLFLPLP